MKIKTSITLSREILDLIDKYAEGENSRSAFIELAVRTYLNLVERNRRDQNDLEILNRHSEELNREALDVLQYQAEL
jgi:metal-responsive CopG/Arc/MetJ family transcriptional regulator